jgi:2-polyprenyl-3-methyl-5-hydroxy-6-metoxy-1,4-benzoquinol methylase
MKTSATVNRLTARVDFEKLVDEVLEEYKTEPVQLSANETDSSAVTYLKILRSSYVRTLEDIAEWTEKSGLDKVKILEIGSFTGFVSICLSRLGYEVVATDISDFIDNECVQKKFAANNITSFGHDLKEPKIPVSNHEYHVVIMCEVLEHLNFNPLPLLQEINRIIKNDGLFYLSLPNIASLKNRLSLLKGRSIHNPVQHLIWQLDPGNTMKIGLHWREYTLEEIDEILKLLGFVPEKHYYFDWFDKVTIQDKKPLLSSLKFPFKKALYYFCPDLKENQTVLAKKVKDVCGSDFIL